MPFAAVSIAADLGVPDRALVLRALRRPGDRAGDQARLRRAVPAHVPGRSREQPGGAARVRSRPRDDQPLRAAPARAGAAAGRRVRLPDAVLLPQGRANVSLSAVWANLGILGAARRREDGAEVRRRLPAARRYCAPHAAFTTLLMSTGLTFGTITSLYGLQSGSSTAPSSRC